MRLFCTIVLAAVLVGQAAQALDAASESWVQQVGDATKACSADKNSEKLKTVALPIV
jgi:hypothetical protein